MEGVPMIKGTDAALRNINAQIQRMGSITVQRMQHVLMDLMRRSQAIVPHDKGDLEGSATWDMEIEGTRITGVVSYNTPYARIQHETPHFKHKPGRRWKYLESPLRENADRYIDYIAEGNRQVNR